MNGNKGAKTIVGKREHTKTNFRFLCVCGGGGGGRGTSQEQKTRYHPLLGGLNVIHRFKHA